MERVSWAKWSERLWAASDDGVISVRAMVRLGVPERTAYRWCQHGGPCRLLLPAAMMLHNGEPSRRQKELATLLHAGRDAVLTGMTAGRHLRLRRGPDPELVHALIPADRQVRSVGFALIERTRRLPRALERDGLPVAPLVRAVLDEARRMKDPKAIAALLAEPVQRGWVLPDALHEELEAGTRWHTAAVRPVVRAILDGARSSAEVDAVDWWGSQPDLPRARFNARLRLPGGRPLGVADAYVEEVGLVWEIDSVEWHFATPEQVERTTARRRGFEAAGLVVVATRPSQLRDDPAGVQLDLLRQIAVAAALPTPELVVTDDLPRSA